MLKRQLLILIIMIFSCSISAQHDSLENNPVFEFTVPSFKIDKIETIDWLKTNLFSINKNEFSLQTSFRIDEEMPYSKSNKVMFRDFYFIDLDINYSFKSFTMSFSIENLLHLTNTIFEIESEYIDDFQTVSIFTQQPNTIASLKLVYNF